MDKRNLTERDICTKFILPAIKRAGWDEMLPVREEAYFTKGRIIVRGKLVTRGKAKDAKYGFGRLIDLARAEPVVVAKHGQSVVVVMAVEEYERLKVFKMGHVDSRPSKSKTAE
jgi:prevent-host-death family protein